MHTRLAQLSDVSAIEALIPLSVRGLQANYYTPEQMDGALGTVFAVDSQLIRDKTYFVTDHDGEIVGCGGWSRRQTLFGGNNAKVAEDTLLDPETDPARVRAFFIHPDFARRGIGSLIMRLCEEAIIESRFKHIRIVATLAGEPFYARFGYMVTHRYDIPLNNGKTLPVVDMEKQILLS
ncbi:MAG: GNAT family N-acetyltransferase [Xenococcaceae cyanobacterium MO_188.B29]|nr:GNAT family N-acetyltransferase [Xenococcaceae cyanobacterium MO_188.B29]